MVSMELPKGYSQGRARPFYTSNPLPSVIERSILSNVDRFCVFFLAALGVMVRLYKLPEPNEVVFDEVHFGRFVNQFIQGKFFVDVHPPLAKLVYYAIAILCGYKGDFEFGQIGEKYDDSVPYIMMRLFSGICGLLTVPVTYMVLRTSFCGTIPSFVGSVLVLFENSIVTQSRFIFLDAPLLLATACSIWMFNKFRLTTAFTGKWHTYLFLTGLSLACVCSIKASGLFTYLYIVVLLALQLWNILGDGNVTDWQWWKHVFWRFIYLFLIPLTVYMAIFAVNFHLLPYIGRSAGPLSPSFKSTFKDFDRMRTQPVDVVYGSTITIRHNEVGGYLHSHDFKYKSGSGQQQVTLYPYHTDFNNEWEIHPKNKQTDAQLYDRVRPVKDGDVVRLFHKATGKYLRVNDVRPPITEKDYANEVACDGNKTQLGDVNYEFKVRILQKKPHGTTNLPMIKLRATESVFQLFHQGTRCTMVGHGGKLPKWAFGQNEVLCINDPTIPNTMWYIEYNNHPVLDNDDKYARVDYGNYNFFHKFVEYHKVMLQFNGAIGNDHEYSSRPETWPFLLRGVGYYSTNARVKLASEPGKNVYLLGNLAVYYLGLLSIMFIGLKQVIRVINISNPFKIPNETINITMFYRTTFESVLGFFLHYQPYFYMKRELFLHHYIPAVYFMILTISYFLEYQVSKRKLMGYILCTVIVGLTISSFMQFRPIIYGLPWTGSQCEAVRWIQLWDIDCKAYK